MAQQIRIEPTKSYVSEATAHSAVNKKFGGSEYKDLRYFIYKVDDVSDVKHYGRYVPVFVGINAVDNGVHFHFNVIGA